MTTIEVVSALLLFSIALIPILQVHLNAARNAQVVSAVWITANLEQRALSYLQTLNFARTPNGSYDFGDGSISWRASVLSDDARITIGDQVIELYRIEVEIRPRELETKSRVLHSIGWRPR